jgi:hypothetical protein
MKRFKVTDRFSLDFLGKDWKRCYIDFEKASIGDIKHYFPKFQAIDATKQEAVIRGIDEVIKFLKEKFVSGKGFIKDKGLVDLEAGDIESLPAEVLSRALSFLSKGVGSALETKSETP